MRIIINLPVVANNSHITLHIARDLFHDLQIFCYTELRTLLQVIVDGDFNSIFFEILFVGLLPVVQERM
jgi:hypothetical protein